MTYRFLKGCLMSKQNILPASFCDFDLKPDGNTRKKDLDLINTA